MPDVLNDVTFPDGTGLVFRSYRTGTGVSSQFPPPVPDVHHFFHFSFRMVAYVKYVTVAILVSVLLPSVANSGAGDG